MAHELQFFLSGGHVVPDDTVDQALAAIREHGLDLAMVGISHGEDWIAGSLQRESRSTGILFEAHGADAAMSTAADWAGSLPNAPDLGSASGLCIVTLSGAVDWVAVDALRRHWALEWSVVELHAADGFKAR